MTLDNCVKGVCANGADIIFSTADPLEGAFKIFVWLDHKLMTTKSKQTNKNIFSLTKRHF